MTIEEMIDSLKKGVVNITDEHSDFSNNGIRAFVRRKLLSKFIFITVSSCESEVLVNGERYPRIPAT